MQATYLEDVARPDVIALDKNGQTVLIAVIKGYPFHFQDQNNKKYAILRLIDYLKSAKEMIPFAMLVDTQNILFFHWDGKNLSEPILSLKTHKILNHYEPNFSKKEIFSLYLTGLIEAWISDFCYHWKLENPPASKEIAEIGLLQRLEGGITQP